MGPWLIPLTIETASAALFAGLLLARGRVPRPPELGLWAIIWGARMGASLVMWAAWVNWAVGSLLLYAAFALFSAWAMAMLVDRLEAGLADERFQRVEAYRSRNEVEHTDALTGVLNRAALERFLAASRAEGVLVVCDLDNFKQVNDSLGHVAGDEMLSGVGRLIRSSIRLDDQAFRWGGDEFVLFFRGASLEVVEARMRALEERLRSFRLRSQSELPVRLSWGAAAAGGRPLLEVIEDADRSMYRRKREHLEVKAASHGA